MQITFCFRGNHVSVFVRKKILIYSDLSLGNTSMGDQISWSFSWKLTSWQRDSLAQILTAELEMDAFNILNLYIFNSLTTYRILSYMKVNTIQDRANTPFVQGQLILDV